MLPRSIFLPLCGVFVLLCGIGAARADDLGAPIEAVKGDSPVQPREAPPGSGFTVLGMVQSRAVMTSVATTNPFLDGQVMGVLGGTNGTTVSAEDRALAVEQRGLGFFSYAPPILDGRFEMGAAFEADFVWGDQSYSSGGNTGGAFGGDQVNLQTRRLYGAWHLKRGGHRVNVVGGLQFVSDGATDPTGARPDDLFRSGGKLIFWGSEASGISVYGRYSSGMWERVRYRLGAYTLYEEAVGSPDDVTLVMADAALHPATGTLLGLHAWYLRDNAGGQGGGLFGSGPTSPLAQLQGAALIDVTGDGSWAETDADLLWFGVDLASNHDLSRGRLGGTALAVANVGRLYVTDFADIPMAGALANAELRYRYAPGMGSVLRAEALYVSGDHDPEDGRYTGIITGNSYGIVGSVYASHGALLLFPDSSAINRQVALVYDASNQGDGLLGLSASAGYDLIPNKLTAVVGGAAALVPGGDPVGEELNARLKYKPWMFSNLDLAAAVVTGSDQPATPWALMLYFDALVF